MANKLIYNKDTLSLEEIKKFSGVFSGYYPTGDTITCKHTTYHGNKIYSETWILFRSIDGSDVKSPILVIHD